MRWFLCSWEWLQIFDPIRAHLPAMLWRKLHHRSQRCTEIGAIKNLVQLEASKAWKIHISLPRDFHCEHLNEHKLTLNAYGGFDELAAVLGGWSVAGFESSQMVPNWRGMYGQVFRPAAIKQTASQLTASSYFIWPWKHHLTDILSFRIKSRPHRTARTWENLYRFLSTACPAYLIWKFIFNRAQTKKSITRTNQNKMD